MAKRALIIGISEYNPPIGDLEAAVPEAERWEALLKNRFGFSTTLRRNSEATLATVKDDLEILLKGTATGDQAVFVFCGHGDLISAGNRVGDEALILHHPTQSDPLTDIEFANVVKPHLTGVTFTVVLECCFSGGFEPSQFLKALRATAAFFGFEGARILSPDRPRGLPQESFDDVRPFGLLVTLPADVKRPLIVAACGPSEKAAQMPRVPFKPRHMRFSGNAIPLLDNTPDISHEQLRDKLNPVDTDPIQNIILKGDVSRAPHKFFT
jgi:hypothetical protein